MPNSDARSPLGNFGDSHAAYRTCCSSVRVRQLEGTGARRNFRIHSDLVNQAHMHAEFTFRASCTRVTE